METNLSKMNIASNNKLDQADIGGLFADIKSLFEASFDDDIYSKYLSKIELFSLKNDSLILSCDTRFLRDWISQEYLSEIKELIFQAKPQINKIALIHVVKNDKKDNEKLIKSVKTDKKIINLSKNDNIFALGVELNEKYTFEAFATNKSNKLAYMMAKNIAKNFNNNQSCEPLFLYGSVGIGKTHLAQAIALDAQKNHPESRIMYLSAERFMYQFVQSLRNKDMLSFKERFRCVDLLIIDDIQFIAGKESTQEEFLHTFNSLIENKKQIILVCDKAPAALSDIDLKIKSRISSGMVANINQPEYELRLDILRKKLEDAKINVDEQVLQLIACHVTSSVRDLEGVIKKIIYQKLFLDEEVTIHDIKHLLKDELNVSYKSVDIEDIIKKTSSFYNITITQMKSKNRSRTIVRPRQVAMYLAKNLTDKSYANIASYFGGKNHATIIHGIKKVEELILTDMVIALDLKKIEENLKK